MRGYSLSRCNVENLKNSLDFIFNAFLAVPRTNLKEIVYQFLYLYTCSAFTIFGEYDSFIDSFAVVVKSFNLGFSNDVIGCNNKFISINQLSLVFYLSFGNTFSKQFKL